MPRSHRPELIRYEIARSSEKSKVVRSHHMMQISFLGTDRAIALACASHVGRDLKPDSSTVTAPYISLPFHDRSSTSRRAVPQHRFFVEHVHLRSRAHFISRCPRPTRLTFQTACRRRKPAATPADLEFSLHDTTYFPCIKFSLHQGFGEKGLRASA
jgi:hypothetical protein